MEDALLKAGLQAVLGPFVRVAANYQVHPPAQFVDVYVGSVADDPEAMWRSLGWLGRIASMPCLIEGFSRAVPEDEALECHRKQLNTHHELERGAYQEASSGGQDATPTAKRSLLPLWLLSWGRPGSLLVSWGMTPVEGWPTGVYRTGPGLAAWLIVLPELPRAPETLALRLFGDDDLRFEVAQELKRLEPDHPLRQGVQPMLYRWQVWLRGEPQDARRRQLIMDLEQLVQEDMRRLEAKGEARGETRGLRKAIEALCEILGLELSDDRKAEIAAMDLAQLEAKLERLRRARAW